MSTITTEQYLGLSGLVYGDLSGYDVNESLKTVIYNDDLTLRKSSLAEASKGSVESYIADLNEDGTLVNFDGWSLIKFVNNLNGSGFAGAAFKSPDGQIVFAFRGTEPGTWQDA